VNFVCAVLLRDRNEAVGAILAAFDVRLFKRVEFWALLGFGFFSMLGYVVLLFSIPNYANQIGLSAKQASVVGALLNLGQGIGRPPMGYFSDTIGRINMAGMLSCLAGVLALVVWVNAKSYGVRPLLFMSPFCHVKLTALEVLIFYSMIGGTVAGTYWATVAPVSAEVIGLKELPSALSITWVVLTIPTLCKPDIT